MVFTAMGGAPTLVYSRRDGRVGNPVFSVNGARLAFTYDVSKFQNESGRQLDARILLLGVVGTRDTVDVSSLRVDNNQNQNNKPAGTNDLEPRFSPNGAQLIFTNTDNTGTAVRSTYLVDLDGRNRKLLYQQAEMPYYR